MTIFSHTASFFRSLCPHACRTVFLSRYAPIMTEKLRTLNWCKCSTIEINGLLLPQLTLSNGIILVGYPSTTKERELFKGLFEKIGLMESHISLCIDYFTRFKHPHMAVGFDEINGSTKKRRFFHPQHYNLAQECSTFSAELKKTIRKKFTFEKDWIVVDVGAYLGYGSLWAASRLSNGRVLSVEAVEENFVIADSIRQFNSKDNWTLLNAAIWHTADEVVEISRTDRQANAIDRSVVKGGVTQQVKTTSIPALTEICGKSIDLLSLTVNGAELEAIEGMNALKKNELPKRVLTPGWYKKDGVVRADMIEPLLSDMGYVIARTPGNFIYAWIN